MVRVYVAHAVYGDKGKHHGWVTVRDNGPFVGIDGHFYAIGMTPEQARKLAGYLLAIADAVEKR